MSEQNNGGPAFPLAFKWDDDQLNGMTLRDYFAAKAMQEHIRNAWEVARLGNGDAASKLMANVEADAYKNADAMLKARG